MAQHFLLSSMARSFSMVKIARMTEKQAETMFRKVRWSDTNGKPVCPRCGSLSHYNLATRKVYKCKDCSKQYSVTIMNPKNRTSKFSNLISKCYN